MHSHSFESPRCPCIHFSSFSDVHRRITKRISTNYKKQHMMNVLSPACMACMYTASNEEFEDGLSSIDLRVCCVEHMTRAEERIHNDHACGLNKSVLHTIREYIHIKRILYTDSGVLGGIANRALCIDYQLKCVCIINRKAMAERRVKETFVR